MNHYLSDNIPSSAKLIALRSSIIICLNNQCEMRIRSLPYYTNISEYRRIPLRTRVWCSRCYAGGSEIGAPLFFAGGQCVKWKSALSRGTLMTGGRKHRARSCTRLIHLLFLDKVYREPHDRRKSTYTRRRGPSRDPWLTRTWARAKETEKSRLSLPRW